MESLAYQEGSDAEEKVWAHRDVELGQEPMSHPPDTRFGDILHPNSLVGGLDADTALLEARRCLSCGNCFNCDNCYAVCPDNAVIKLGPGKRYTIKYDYCKGCGLCAGECPCGAIDMIRELK